MQTYTAEELIELLSELIGKTCGAICPKCKRVYIDPERGVCQCDNDE